MINLTEAKKILEDNGYTLLKEGIIDTIGAKIGSRLSNHRLTETDIKALGHLSKIEEYVAKNVPFTAVKEDYTLNLMDGIQVHLVQDFKNNRFYLSDQMVIINTKEPILRNGAGDKEDVYPLYKNIGFIVSHPKPFVKPIYKIIDSWKEIKEWLNNEVIPSINKINDAENDYAAENEKYRKISVRNFKL